MASHAVVKHEKKGETATPQRTRALTYTPRCDIFETQDELVLFADLPGVRPEDVDVRYENGELVIEGRCEPRQDGVDYLGCEYGVGDYYRAFTISEAIDSGKISAELKQGVLT